jgi:hypothetical protein
LRAAIRLRCGKSHEVARAVGTAGQMDRDAGMAARDEPCAIGSTLARCEIRRRVERGTAG